MDHPSISIFETRATTLIIQEIGAITQGAFYVEEGAIAFEKCKMALRWAYRASCIQHQVESVNFSLPSKEVAIILDMIWQPLKKTYPVENKAILIRNLISDIEIVCQALLELTTGHFAELAAKDVLLVKECYAGARVNLMEASLILKNPL